MTDDTGTLRETGARRARSSWLSELVSRAASEEMHAFVVPGEDRARALGLDLEAAGLRIASTPRHASVLLIVGELSPGMARAASVSYAQMPRPRAVLAVVAGDASPLLADVSVASGQEELASGVARLRRLFAGGAFREDVAVFDAEAARTRTEYTCAMHPEVARNEPGSCPVCDMDLVPTGHGASHAEGGEHEDDGSAKAGEKTGDSEPDGGVEHGEHGYLGDNYPASHEETAGMDFMSMAAMTEDLPRSGDGLRMERVEVPFGPLFPGLPGGLALTFTLDGDTVAKTVAASTVGVRSLEGPADPAGAFADRLALLDPLSPVAYRILALRAIENAVGLDVDERTALSRAGALERERAASHLGHLANLGRLLGHVRLARRAGRLQLAVLRVVETGGARLRADEAGKLARLRTETGKFTDKVLRAPLLKHRLRGIGVVHGDADGDAHGDATGPTGPVARARGVRVDVRADERAYGSLGFEPVVRDGGDALSRVRVRLEEIGRSLDLALAAGSVSVPKRRFVSGLSGEGSAAVETPRGAAMLRVRLESSRVSILELRTPSTRHLGLVGAVTGGRELADALIGVASLDLSPWEVIL